MIYLFENPDFNASIVYDETTLTDAQKNKGVALDKLPTPEMLEGKMAVLKVKKSTGEVWYEYIDKPVDKEQELEEKINLMQQALDDLLLGGAL
jgi:hypothetical protein